jgi:ATP-dependent DNA helicase RecG
VLRESNDGFVIAERDLEIRGPGEVLGTKQTGLAEFKIADLNRDKQTLNHVRPIAFKILNDYPTLTDKLIQRWLAGKSDYAQA